MQQPTNQPQPTNHRSQPTPGRGLVVRGCADLRAGRGRVPLLQRGPHGDVPPHRGGKPQVPGPLQPCERRPISSSVSVLCFWWRLLWFCHCSSLGTHHDRRQPTPKKQTKELQDLVKRLLVRRPALRLGVQAGGADDIKRHPWFGSFDWAAFEAKTMKAPYVPKVSCC